MKTTIQLLLLLAASGFAATAHAAACGELRADIKTASDLLNKAQQAELFENAKREIKKAGATMNTLAEDARSCPCPDAAALFDEAAGKMHRASVADGIGRFNEFSKQGVERYAAAIDALNACPQSLQQNSSDDAGSQDAGTPNEDEGESR